MLEYLPPHSALPSGFRRGAGRDDTQGKTHTGKEKAAEESCMGKDATLSLRNRRGNYKSVVAAGFDQVFTPLSASSDANPTKRFARSVSREPDFASVGRQGGRPTVRAGASCARRAVESLELVGLEAPHGWGLTRLGHEWKRDTTGTI